MSEWLHSVFSGSLPILPPCFGLVELCVGRVCPGKGQTHVGGWLLRGGGKVRLRHGAGAGGASAPKGASRALGRLTGGVNVLEGLGELQEEELFA